MIRNAVDGKVETVKLLNSLQLLKRKKWLEARILKNYRKVAKNLPKRIIQNSILEGIRYKKSVLLKIRQNQASVQKFSSNLLPSLSFLFSTCLCYRLPRQLILINIPQQCITPRQQLNLVQFQISKEASNHPVDALLSTHLGKFI